MEEFMSMAAGMLVPLLVSWLKSQTWPNGVKVLLTLIVSLVGGIFATWAGNLAQGTNWTWGDWVKNSGLVFTAATVFYKSWFQGRNFDSDLTRGGPFGNASQRPQEAPGAADSPDLGLRATLAATRTQDPFRPRSALSPREKARLNTRESAAWIGEHTGPVGRVRDGSAWREVDPATLPQQPPLPREAFPGEKPPYDRTIDGPRDEDGSLIDVRTIGDLARTASQTPQDGPRDAEGVPLVSEDPLKRRRPYRGARQYPTP